MVLLCHVFVLYLQAFYYPQMKNDEHMELVDYLKNHNNMGRQFRFCGLLLKLSTKPSTAIRREG
jgi:hypothetical protein